MGSCDFNHADAANEQMRFRVIRGGCRKIHCVGCYRSPFVNKCPSCTLYVRSEIQDTYINGSHIKVDLVESGGVRRRGSEGQIADIGKSCL